MITYPLVKDAIKLPAGFLLIFIIVLLIFSFFNLLALLISTYSNFSQIGTGILVTTILNRMLNTLPVALIVSLLLMLLNLSLKPAPGFFPVLLLFLTVYLIYTGFLLGLTPLAAVNQPAALTAHYFTKEQFSNTGSYFIYPGNIDQNRFQDTLIFDSENPNYKFTFYPKIESILKDNTITLNLANKKITTNIDNPYIRFLYEYDQFSGDIIRAFALFNSDLIAYAQKPGFMFYFSCFAFVFFIISCGIFTRITRWPLFNLLLFAVIITLFIIMYGFYKTELHDELTNLMKKSPLLDYLPVFVMTGLGILFILVDIIFIPHKLWKEGIKVD